MAEQKNKIGPVWVVAEQIDCRLLSVSTQLTGQARKLADNGCDQRRDVLPAENEEGAW